MVDATVTRYCNVTRNRRKPVTPVTTMAISGYNSVGRLVIHARMDVTGRVEDVVR